MIRSGTTGVSIIASMLSANPEATRTETQDIIGLILVYGIIACSLVAMLLCER